MPPDRHQLAIAILAIATAAIGFGLFGSDVNLGIDVFDAGITTTLRRLRFGLVVAALVCYAGVIVTVGRILFREDNATGRELVLGPMRWMVFEMLSLALIFVIGKSLDDAAI